MNAPASADCLKLTAYLGERKRAQGRLATDALLDLYERGGLAASILLRGIEGFGRKHHLRTDSSLTLSEDLPAVTVAIDVSERIEAVLEDAVRITGSGLVTLERARMQRGSLHAITLPEDRNDATKLTVYLGRQERAGERPAFAAVCELLQRHGVSGASTLLGVDGTTEGERQRARFFARNADVPVMVLAVGAAPRIGAALPELGALLRRPLVTLEGVRICKRDGVLLQLPDPAERAGADGVPARQKLTVFTSESQLHRGRPVHRALLTRLRESGAAGATTVRGIWGFHGDHAPHGDRTFQLGRHVPTLTTIIDAPERIAALFPIVDEMTAEHGLVTSESVH